MKLSSRTLLPIVLVTLAGLTIVLWRHGWQRSTPAVGQAHALDHRAADLGREPDGVGVGSDVSTAPTRAEVPDSGSPSHLTGILRSSDGLEPVSSCPFTLGGQAKARSLLTDRDGRWSVALGPGNARKVRVAFYPYPEARLTYTLDVSTAIERDTVLRMPRLDSLRVTMRSDDDLLWDASFGVAQYPQSSAPTQFVTGELSVLSEAGGRQVEVLILPRSENRLRRDSAVLFHCLPGHDVVVQAFSVQHDITPERVRASVPGNVVLRAEPIRSGLTIRHHAEYVNPSTINMVFWKESSGTRWRRLPMYGGIAHLALDALPDREVAIELRGAKGELFHRLIRTKSLPSVLDLRAGEGVAPASWSVSHDSRLVGVFLSGNDHEFEALEPASFDAMSARQYVTEGSSVLVSAPADSGPVWLLYADGCLVRCDDHGGSGAVIRQTQTSTDVVPPYLLRGLTQEEAVLATLEVNLSSNGDVPVWVPLDRRRIQGGERTPSWSIRPALGHEYRVMVEPMHQRGEAWERRTPPVYYDLDGFQLSPESTTGTGLGR